MARSAGGPAMKIAAVIAVLLITGAALAQTPPSAITTRDPAAPPPITAPASIGKPHVCLDAYPKEAIADFLEGNTVLAFTITADGGVKDIRVHSSSGHELLDQAAMTCASTWRYKPAIQNSVPIDVPWKAQVVWTFVSRFAEPPRDCARSYPVTAAMLAGIDGVTELDITITGDQVESIVVTHESGNTALDNAALACVKTWKFQPLIRDGQPFSRIRPAIIIWKKGLMPQ